MNQRDPAKDASPGPWSLMERSAEWLITDCRGNTGGYAVAAVPKYEDCTLERVEANARLIAAAPELLEALKEARSDYLSNMASEYDYTSSIWFERCGHTDKALLRMDAAIARAEGRA